MKPGDIIEWRGANKTLRGMVTKSENGELYVKMADGHTFSLSDLRHSWSVKLIEV